MDPNCWLQLNLFFTRGFEALALFSFLDVGCFPPREKDGPTDGLAPTDVFFYALPALLSSRR